MFVREGLDPTTVPAPIKRDDVAEAINHYMDRLREDGRPQAMDGICISSEALSGGGARKTRKQHRRLPSDVVRDVHVK